MSKGTELVATEKNYLVDEVNIGEMMSEEMEGMTPSFDKVKIPAGGGTAYEIPGEDPDSPDMVKEFKAVIVYHHPMNVYYKDKYDGSNNPPDCSSMDGKTGLTAEGEIIDCMSCPNFKFGSGEDGKGKACKQKRRIYILREGEILPMLLTLPTGSLQEFSKYIMRLLNKGKKSNSVVTKFTLKKAQSSGITYSQAVFTADRDLSPEERTAVAKMTDQIKAVAGTIFDVD